MKLTSDQKANNKRLREGDKLIKNRIPKHNRFDEIMGVTGVVDSHGSVRWVIVFRDENEDDLFHEHCFGKVSRYKPWRWWSHSGMDNSVLATVSPNTDDWESIKNWLYKHGCLNDWEI